MSFNQSLTIDEQLGTHINADHSNTLTVQNYGGPEVALFIKGVPELTGAGPDGSILTIMTAAECLGFIRLLQDVCRVAAGNEELVP
ncbi:MAG: hypothetical protein ACXW1W_02845 [Methylococcaceae bacterium]